MTSSRNNLERRAGSLASSPDGLQTHYAHDGIRVASFRNIALVHWGSRATREPVRALGAVSAELIRKHQRISVVQMIPDNVGMPDDEIRSSMLKLAEVGALSLACLAYVLGGDGFWASAVRGVITSTTWVYQRPFLARICTTVDEVATWLPAHHAERTGVTVEPDVLLDVLKRVFTSPADSSVQTAPGGGRPSDSRR